MTIDDGAVSRGESLSGAADRYGDVPVDEERAHGGTGALAGGLAGEAGSPAKTAASGEEAVPSDESATRPGTAAGPQGAQGAADGEDRG